ncbi:sugar transferase [Tellurirhabdus bombi]|uniref:sugar transferase n=1 Tax=Tellurirhabdus bombi TaxID=2907205 RepID=UPI001F1822D7|nr:sugar transferase [Tellurirhabdus bombi]
MYRTGFKPLIDYTLALLGLLLSWPILLITAIVLSVANEGKAFFLQPRPGKHGRVFRIIKFKTMNDKRDAVGNLLPDKERLTWVGQLVRKTSIDELPQLLNVLKGDMSLIGPRPLLVDYLPLYNSQQRRRHDVKPGITGWAQVNGRNAISWQEKFAYDVWYVDNVSFYLDVKIIALTLKKFIRPEGISSATSVTMERFTGNH